MCQATGADRSVDNLGYWVVSIVLTEIILKNFILKFGVAISFTRPYEAFSKN